MDRIGIDALLTAGVALWFIVDGATQLPGLPTGGRRAAVPVPVWLRVARRLRGIAEILVGMVVLASALVNVAGLRVSLPDRALGLTLAALAAWSAIEAGLRRRWVRLGFAVLCFFLAVFYAGFR